MLKYNCFYNNQIKILGSDRSGGDNYDEACQGSTGKEKQDPPLFYDVNIDPGERYPLDNSTDLYQYVKFSYTKHCTQSNHVKIEICVNRFYDIPIK